MIMSLLFSKCNDPCYPSRSYPKSLHSTRFSSPGNRLPIWNRRLCLYSNPRRESTIILQVELIFIFPIGVQLGLANVSFRRISNLSEIRVNFTKYYLHVVTVSKRRVCHHQKRERWHSSSIGSLGFCTSCAVWAVAPVAHCQALEYVICSFYEISLPATSALFFFRVRTVYNDNKIVTAFFGALWFFSTRAVHLFDVGR